MFAPPGVKSPAGRTNDIHGAREEMSQQPSAAQDSGGERDIEESGRHASAAASSGQIADPTGQCRVTQIVETRRPYAVILSEAKHPRSFREKKKTTAETLRCAQGDRPTVFHFLR